MFVTVVGGGDDVFVTVVVAASGMHVCKTLVRAVLIRSGTAMFYQSLSILLLLLLLLLLLVLLLLLLLPRG